MIVTTEAPKPTVELRPYTGMESRRGKLREATRPQKWVWLTTGEPGDEPSRVGIVADKPGSRFCAVIPLSEFTPEELLAIDAAIEEFHGQAPPPAKGTPANINADDSVGDDIDTVDDSEIEVVAGDPPEDFG